MTEGLRLCHNQDLAATATTSQSQPVPTAPAKPPAHTDLPKEDEEEPVPRLLTPWAPVPPSTGQQGRQEPCQGDPIPGQGWGLPGGIPVVPDRGWRSPVSLQPHRGSEGAAALGAWLGQSGDPAGCLGSGVPPRLLPAPLPAQGQLCSPRKSAPGSAFNPFWAPGCRRRSGLVGLRAQPAGDTAHGGTCPFPAPQR